jgi:hypothetical protein
MKTTGIIFAFIVFLFALCHPVYAGDLERANELGEDFQRQMPYSRERPQTGETPGQTQPRDYVAPPERERSEPAPQPGGGDYPVCYNPYTRVYENCYPQDSEYWRLRYNSPDFRFWWEQGRSCPSGYYFRQGRGCYRY